MSASPDIPVLIKISVFYGEHYGSWYWFVYNGKCVVALYRWRWLAVRKAKQIAQNSRRAFEMEIGP